MVGAGQASPQTVQERSPRLRLSGGACAAQLFELKNLRVAIGSEAAMAVRLQDAAALRSDRRSKTRFDGWLVFEPRDPALVWSQAAAAPGASPVRNVSGLEWCAAGPENEFSGCLQIVEQGAALSSSRDIGVRPRTRDEKRQRSGFDRAAGAVRLRVCGFLQVRRMAIDRCRVSGRTTIGSACS